jgi:IS30 family transposase
MYKHLTQFELYYIWQNCMHEFKSMPINTVAHNLKKHRATIYRAISYIKKTNWRPDEHVKFRKRNKVKFTKFSKKIKAYITEHIKLGWSPEVISGRMKKDIRQKVSCKSIYSYIYQDKANGGKLYKLLPHHGKKYKYSSNKNSKIPNRRDITERPAIVETKSRIGDLEGDTIVGVRGGDKACLLTLVDRKSKYTMIRKIPNKTALAVENGMDYCYDNTLLPFITVTYDNGTEFSKHENIANKLDCDIYFAHPYRSCERGLNEHTNGKIRYFFPKKTDFGNVTDEEVQQVQNLLNDRPRKSLNFLTPNEVVNKELAKAYKKLSHFI